MIVVSVLSNLRAGLAPYLFICLFMTFTVPAVLAQGESAEAPGITHEAFTEERFAELQSADEIILIDIFATWCPTCAKQQKVLHAFRESNPGAPLRILQIDFDEQKEWVMHFKAPRQSTLILYKGEQQLWFSVAETKQKKIFEALNMALSEEASTSTSSK